MTYNNDESIFGSKKYRILIAIFMIILGYVTADYTHNYGFPFGSILMIILGLLLIFGWKYIK